MIRGYLINPYTKTVREVSVNQLDDFRKSLGRCELGYHIPGHISYVAHEGVSEITHSINGHLCMGNTIITATDSSTDLIELGELEKLISYEG